MLLIVLISATVVGGLAAITAAQPKPSPTISIWSDDAERRLLHEGKLERTEW